MSVIDSKNERCIRKSALWAVAAMGCVSAFGIQAAVVDSGAVSIAIPATTSGIYLNVVTGVSGTATGAPGWDFNPWGSTNRQFFWPTAPAGTSGGVATGTTYNVLNPGDVVGPASTFITDLGAAAAANFNTGTPGQKIIGFRFNNEAGPSTHYGYAVLQSANASGVPGTIIRYVFESTPNTAITVAGGGPTDTPPQFAYTPAAGQTVTATGGGAVGSSGTLTITPSIGTAGTGTGTAATTTLTCTAPTTPFSGFGQSVTAVGNGAISGGPLSGSCTLGATVATQTLTCNENRGGTANARTWTLSCPAGTLNPLTSTPASASSIALPAQVVGAPATTATLTFQNPNASPVTVTCTAPAATQFTVNPLVINVPANSNAGTTISYTSATVGNVTGSLTCTAGAQTFTYTLNGTTVGQVQAVDALGNLAKLLMLLAVLGVGLVAVRRH